MVAYRAYITDILMVVTENTAKYAGGSYVTTKFTDIINPAPIDTRTGGEVAADIIKRAGLVVTP